MRDILKAIGIMLVVSLALIVLVISLASILSLPHV